MPSTERNPLWKPLNRSSRFNQWVFDKTRITHDPLLDFVAQPVLRCWLILELKIGAIVMLAGLIIIGSALLG
jgi:hypothetical protein